MIPENHIIGLFPTPFMRVEKLLPPSLVAALIAEFSDAAKVDNAKSGALAHTVLQHPEASPLLNTVSDLVLPRLVDFGELLFGETLPWSIKEIWLNALHHGGHQAMHNHANCFVSGVLYLTDSHPSAHTVFMKGPGGRDFAFSHAHAGTAQGPFNADKWIAPPPSPGDLVMFPSYLLHEVPVNEGGLRLSMAFNAIPEQLNSWGYSIAFNARKGTA